MFKNQSVSWVRLQFVYLLIVLFPFLGKSQSLQHPHIWVNNADKKEILSNIDKYEWAASMFKQLKSRQNKSVVNHKKNPATILAEITTIPGDRSTHMKILNTGAESAILYYLTGEEQYAQLSADILNQYVKMISVQDPLTIDFFAPHRADNHHIMMREDFPRIAIIYDFIHSFISKKGTTVFDLKSNSRIPFDFSIAQKAFEVQAEAVLKQGGMDSNHPVLELTGGLYNVLCMEDDAVRKSYYDRFWKGEPGQNGITWMLEHFTKEESMWPESVGYSRLTHNIIIKTMNVIDRYDPERKIIQNNLNLLDGIFIFENYKYPNGKIMAYGDLRRDDGDNTYLYQNVLAISNRLGLKDHFVRAASTLKAIYTEEGGYKPLIAAEKLDWQNPLQLLWGVNIPDSISNKNPLATTVTAKYAGVVMQRNYVAKNNTDYGLMYYTGGGTYVHAHDTGLDMEFYGAGYVMGPDYGSDTYGSAIHETYATNPAAHNTIIVNGTTHRAPKIKGKSTWINIVDPIVLEACEPKAYEKPISAYFCFSAQYLDDKINSVDQLRTNGIIRTSPTSGYYVDIFRSKSKIKNDFHDYLFHGLGDAMTLKTKDSALALQSTPERYQNDIGDEKKQPGWRWFTDTKTSLPTATALNIRFYLDATNKYLHVKVPAGIEKEYSSALSPPTKAVNNGYDKKKTQVFVMRKYGEAWDKPFVAIYEPSGSTTSTVESTTLLYQKDKVVGVKVISKVGGAEITDYILSNDKDDESIALDSEKISFKGRFGIVRTEVKNNKTQLTLYIGKGEKLVFGKKQLYAGSESKAVEQYEME